ncbi:MAG: hypothetical protein ABFE07_28185 [Armatimonadia bacterium]
MTKATCVACNKVQEVPFPSTANAELLRRGWSQLSKKKSGQGAGLTGLCRRCQGRLKP